MSEVKTSQEKAVKEKCMEINTRRSFFSKLAAMAAVITGAPKLFAQQAPPATPPAPGGGRRGGGDGFGGGPRNNVHDGVFWFSGTGSNDGYGKGDHITVKDPFEKHVTRTMDALKKSLERAGSNMDSIIHLDVFLCLPHDDSIPMPTGSARFAAHKAQYDALNKIYGTYFSPGRAPSRACMALEWIPGDSLIEIRGNALIVNAPAPPAGE
jgi:enamine deaminase RidA (YjgF/YER057c/UK114 family)